MITARASGRVQRMRQGRQTTQSIAAESPTRSAVVPEAPTSGKRPLARAAPTWKQAIAIISTMMGTIKEAARPSDCCMARFRLPVSHRRINTGRN